MKSIQVLSALLQETEAENLMLSTVSASGIKFQFNRLSNSDLDITSSHLINIVILPILGDNDLTDELQTKLESFIKHKSDKKNSFIVIAYGDRHVSDEFTTTASPFNIKVHRIFQKFGSFTMLKSKLDIYTATTLAFETLALIDAIDYKDIMELGCIASHLSKAPKWDALKRFLDFYDPNTGYSLLKYTETSIKKLIIKNTQKINPNILKMSHANLDNETLGNLETLLSADALDLSSNHFSWKELLLQLGNCRWLSLAANNLTRLHISQTPRGLEHLYLHKNYIYEFEISSKREIGLKTLSLYRNKLTEFNWSADNTSLLRLNLGANPISYLPETLSNCSSLKYLGLARTRITAFPEWLFSAQNLQEIDISFIEEQIPLAQIVKLQDKGVSFITRPNFIMTGSKQ